jgi:hypothetical protein
MRIFTPLSSGVSLVALGFWPSTAASSWAHDGSASVLDLAPAESAGGVLLLAALGAVIVLGLGGRRRLALALAIALALLGFDIGLHSVHHLDDPLGAGQCAVAWATTHLSGTPVDAPSLVALLDGAPRPSPIPRHLAAPPRPPAPHEGRAPPIALA